MKTYKHLYPQIHDFENLYWAFRKARRGKRKSPDVAAFEFNLEAVDRTVWLCQPTDRPGGQAAGRLVQVDRNGSSGALMCAVLWGRAGRAAGRLVEQESRQGALRLPQQQPEQPEQQQRLSGWAVVHAFSCPAGAKIERRRSRPVPGHCHSAGMERPNRKERCPVW